MSLKGMHSLLAHIKARAHLLATLRFLYRRTLAVNMSRILLRQNWNSKVLNLKRMNTMKTINFLSINFCDFFLAGIFLSKFASPNSYLFAAKSQQLQQPSCELSLSFGAATSKILEISLNLFEITCTDPDCVACSLWMCWVHGVYAWGCFLVHSCTNFPRNRFETACFHDSFSQLSASGGQKIFYCFCLSQDVIERHSLRQHHGWCTSTEGDILSCEHHILCSPLDLLCRFILILTVVEAKPWCCKCSEWLDRHTGTPFSTILNTIRQCPPCSATPARAIAEVTWAPNNDTGTGRCAFVDSACITFICLYCSQTDSGSLKLDWAPWTCVFFKTMHSWRFCFHNFYLLVLWSDWQQVPETS